MAKRIGSVIVWEAGVDVEKAKTALLALAKLGLITPLPNKYNPEGLPAVTEFNDDLGGPVWYIP